MCCLKMLKTAIDFIFTYSEITVRIPEFSYDCPN
jgi:hypothetical protein